jgi:hypothetical protein
MGTVTRSVRYYVINSETSTYTHSDVYSGASSNERVVMYVVTNSMMDIEVDTATHLQAGQRAKPP